MESSVLSLISSGFGYQYFIESTEISYNQIIDNESVIMVEVKYYCYN